MRLAAARVVRTYWRFEGAASPHCVGDLDGHRSRRVQRALTFCATGSGDGNEGRASGQRRSPRKTGTSATVHVLEKRLRSVTIQPVCMPASACKWEEGQVRRTTSARLKHASAGSRIDCQPRCCRSSFPHRHTPSGRYSSGRPSCCLETTRSSSNRTCCCRCKTSSRCTSCSATTRFRNTKQKYGEGGRARSRTSSDEEGRHG